MLNTELILRIASANEDLSATDISEDMSHFHSSNYLGLLLTAYSNCAKTISYEHIYRRAFSLRHLSIQASYF